ncbi:MAG: trypsin-like peptidase domain-containing protein [Candidatus Acidiferrales bacterium]|jgi:DNA-binding response OmpR family regulator/S1-C subfamily serine protease
MDSVPEQIVLLEADPASRDSLMAALQTAGYGVLAFSTPNEVLRALHQSSADVILLDGAMVDHDTHSMLATIRGSATTAGLRVISLTGPLAEDRAVALDLGADDAVSRPWDEGELLARIRAQLRVRRMETDLHAKSRIAEEGQQIAHTAFEALAVTEKMTSDAFALDRRLKTGFTAVFAVAAVMAGLYFLFARSAQKQTTQDKRIIAGLEGGIIKQQTLIAEVRRLRAQQDSGTLASPGKDELLKHAADLKSRLANANSGEMANLQTELAETNARLKRVEEETGSAQTLIPTDVKSVCLLHVSVAFRNVQSGQRLRYAGLNPQGEPIEDSTGNAIVTLDGHGPEVKMDVFGTGFLAGPGGRVITNRHVAEPWWKNDDLAAMTSQGVQAEISSIRAYFPGDPRAFSAEIQDISKDTDLATMAVNMQDLKRTVLFIDSSKTAAQPGEPIVLMGYATGLAALLARTDEDTAQQILTQGGADISQVLDGLAHRNLIRPLITQGHIGDVLADKIVFDAQTTSGGSGGPLINQQGKVVGVTFAVLKGFGGSNFGIPIRFSQPLLDH